MSMLDTPFILDLLARGQRRDGRQLHQFRPITLETNLIPKAEGSARVHLGRSDVLVGIKLALGDPFSDRPDEGVLMVNAELTPIASPLFEMGPPDEESIELARVVDRGIRESHAVALDKLKLKDGKVWMVNVDVHVLNHDGNLIDAAGLAAIAALATTKIPTIAADGSVDYEHRKGALPLSSHPIPVTVWKAGGKLILDPDLAEGFAATARLTVASTEDGRIAALQKGGDEPLTEAEIETAFSLAIEHAKELRKHLSHS